VYPSAVTELYYFSRARWRREFEASGFHTVAVAGSGLFYTGHVLRPGASLRQRECLARLLGSACHAYLLRRG
jgi:hypothetical protein